MYTIYLLFYSREREHKKQRAKDKRRVDTLIERMMQFKVSYQPPFQIQQSKRNLSAYLCHVRNIMTDLSEQC